LTESTKFAFVANRWERPTSSLREGKTGYTMLAHWATNGSMRTNSTLYWSSGILHSKRSGPLCPRYNRADRKGNAGKKKAYDAELLTTKAFTVTTEKNTEVRGQGVPNQILIGMFPELTLYGFYREVNTSAHRAGALPRLKSANLA